MCFYNPTHIFRDSDSDRGLQTSRHIRCVELRTQGAWNCWAVTHLLECGFYAAHGGKAVHFENWAHTFRGVRFLFAKIQFKNNGKVFSAQHCGKCVLKWKKCQKNWTKSRSSKKPLTNGSKSVNIIKLSDKGSALKRQRVRKKLWKKLKKTLDKSEAMWYDIKVASKKAWNKNFEKLEKSLKKVLTKAKRCDIILKLSQRSEKTEPWKLNNNELKRPLRFRFEQVWKNEFELE